MLTRHRKELCAAPNLCRIIYPSTLYDFIDSSKLHERYVAIVHGQRLMVSVCILPHLFHILMRGIPFECESGRVSQPPREISDLSSVHDSCDLSARPIRLRLLRQVRRHTLSSLPEQAEPQRAPLAIDLGSGSGSNCPSFPEQCRSRCDFPTH